VAQSAEEVDVGQSPVSDIPVVIPCGGQGTRIREASDKLPKPMIDVGGRPILWHIMKMYSQHGFRRFVLPAGYKAGLIKEYFLHYREQHADFTIELGSHQPAAFHNAEEAEDWEVTVVETGERTETAARLSMVRDFLDADTFMLTYGDGVSDVDLTALLAHHRSHDLVGTVTAVHPVSRFGELKTEDHRVVEFMEKPVIDVGWINGGFFAFDASFLDYVTDQSAMLESEPLPKLTSDGQLSMYRHEGFWRSMDTYREYLELNGLWDRGEADWKTWSD
jgi:glucose-1-phosphate cytidylyltransferase